MKYTIAVLFTFAASSFAHAAQLKISQADTWKVQIIQKNTPESAMLANAEMTLTQPLHKAGVIPTVLVQKIATNNLPKTTAQWQDLVLKGAKPLRERTLKTGGRTRYLVEFQRFTGSEMMTPVIIMATVVNGEVYALVYSNHAPIYKEHFDEVFKLLKSVQITLD